MKRLLQINVTANWGSHGRIAEELGRYVMGRSWDSIVAYGRRAAPGSRSRLIHIGGPVDQHLHALSARITDSAGLNSRRVTRQFVDRLAKLRPDLVHLHIIHGYYINYPLLFDALRLWGGPVVWTMHDCWPLTGHCPSFISPECRRWRTDSEGCHDCPAKRLYPASLFADRSARNYRLKRDTFTSLGDHLTLVPVSHYIADCMADSYLSTAKCVKIYNGVDTDRFAPVPDVKREPMALAIASRWDSRKGLADIRALASRLPDGMRLCVTGLTDSQAATMPEGTMIVPRVDSTADLAALYSRAAVLVNPTYGESLSMVNLEAQACGTPVATYDAGGTAETVTPLTGIMVPRGDVDALARAAARAASLSSAACRDHIITRFNADTTLRRYFELYESLT